MMTFISQISFLLLLLMSEISFHLSMSSNHQVVRCNEKDRRILSIFKQGINDPFNLLSTWSNVEDCCEWKGVQCHNTTGRVIKLVLSPEDPFKTLKGEINLSLLELEFLNYLDLSNNGFDVISIPPFHDNVTTVSNLQYLDLSWNYNPHMNNIQWLSRLSSLKYLNLSLIDLQRETNWLQLVAMLPSLSELDMRYCNLNNINPSLMYVNFTSLVTIDLSYCNFNSVLPYWLFNLSSGISHIDLGENSFHGEIPSKSSLSLQNLRYLDLSYNQLKGPIPDWIGQQQTLQYLVLSHNLFPGSVPSFLGNITSLTSLSIGSTSLSGAISEIHFSKLKHLKHLDLSNSTFAFDFNPKWIPPFQLRNLILENTNQGPSFPWWIYTQKSLQWLDMSSSGISSIDEDEFWHFVGKIYSLYLSNNSISGDISDVELNSTVLVLDRNNFTGGIPHISPEAWIIDLSHNSFSGPIPRGWENCKDLRNFNLWSNKLTGQVPTDFSNLTQLQDLNLGANQFSGALPTRMPPNLVVMILRSNQFEGNIPSQIFNLSFLFHMDLAHNKLSGSIPCCVYKLTQMITQHIKLLYVSKIDWFTKGQHYEPEMDPERRTIDLSANNLSGEIPLQLFKLIGVQTLNLSHNHLNGTIDKTIGSMKNLESLDFSNNNLSGEIPQSMAGLPFLGYLNLSYNNFHGQIPIGTQLQSFDASRYIGNAELCGAPLTKCIPNEKYAEKEKQDVENGEDDILRKSLYLGMGVGFAVSFGGICGSLILIRKWRHSYYQFLDQMAIQLYVIFFVMINKLQKSKATAS